MDQGHGNFIDNQWVKPTAGTTLTSINPADQSVVIEVLADPSHAQLAVDAARRAQPAWAALTADERIAALRRFARELGPRTESLAKAITLEMGKPLREARIEARSLIARIDMVAEHQLPQVQPWTPTGVEGECRYHALGVIVVLGPFNFPLHLIHAHVIPALATGNTVVIKPSERAPLAAQRYIEALEAAGLPPIVQMVQGGPEVGKALTACEDIHGVAFTGSWRAGHAIEKALFERPEVLVALEMGGQNMALVLNDADIDQAIEGVILGGFMTTGQRCTCTSRVVVERKVAGRFIERLVAATKRLSWGDPQRDDVFMGPMASSGDRDYVDALVSAGVAAGAEVLLAAESPPNAAYRSPSIHQIAVDHDSDYTREEVFGPDLALTIVDDLSEAISVVNRSKYGLSVSVFSARRAALEQVYRETRVGCVNWNRSTNRASGAMPFGGVGRSGNFRPAGSDAVRYTTYPVQMQWNAPGNLEGDPFVRQAVADADPIGTLERSHRIEEACEPYAVYPTFDDAQTVFIATHQLGEALSSALVEALNERGIQVDRTDTELRLPLDGGQAGLARLAAGLSDALFAIRHLDPGRFLARRPPATHVPPGETLQLPRSATYMARLVGDDFIPADKKPPVIDAYRSSGPYLASIDDDPLVIFDAASQVATHAAGLNPPAVLNALWMGRFGALPIDLGDHADNAPALQALAATLRHEAGHHPYVRFCNSGGEANEIALAVCATQRPGKRAIIAFRDGFHGRTYQALHATWNPAKRERFELEGFRARWVDFPFYSTPSITAAEPDGWLDAWRDARNTPPAARFNAGDDTVFAAELRVLGDITEALADDAVACVWAEPMQSEGGERHASARFFRALRVLTEAFSVPLIMDEVQTGFGLGGPFFWHRRFNLPSPPDVIACAKKCQLGAVVSRHPIPVSPEVHGVSAVRGLVNAELIAAARPEAMFADVATRLADLRAKHPETVLAPRQIGYAFGFDLPSPKAVAHLTGQRLWRGYMVYGAGKQALRFRLNPEMASDAIAGLFERLHASLSDLEQGKGTEWRSGATASLSDDARPWPLAQVKLSSSYRLIRVGPADWPAVKSAYLALQKSVYEPARTDDFGHFSALMEDPDAICFVVVNGSSELPPKGLLVGACLGFPLEHFPSLDGPKQDPTLGAGLTLYSADLTVHPEHRGHGIGRLLKATQLSAAMQARRTDGRPRFEFVVGRNRVGETKAMAALNSLFGSVRAERYGNQYGDPDAETDYHRVCLTTPRLPSTARPNATAKTSPLVDLAPGLQRRLGAFGRQGAGIQQLASDYERGHLNGSVVNKLSLCNFVTPSVVRSFEMLRALAPKDLDHFIVASGHAEILDKTLRAMKFHRPKAQRAVALGPVDVGVGTAAARSLGNHPALRDNPDANWFGWPTLADPTVDPEGCLAALRRHLADDAEGVLAVLVEPVYTRTGRAMPASTWGPLRALTQEYGVPLIAIENATAGYRSGRGMWRVDTLPIAVDAVMWFPGGQLGMSFVTKTLHVDAKLTLISTWDGDETSFTRLLWELRQARLLPVAERTRALESTLSVLGPVAGEGLYRTVETPQAEFLARRLADHGVRVGRTEEGALCVAPPLDITIDEIGRLNDLLTE
ncbi:MAG: succinylglutamate-semialdehyde dehydrogenase, partial [Myxococcota bacterium]